ncbi:glycosyltransferase group 2 [Pandoraea terrae]|uniref:Glycosyltransferase group 2 n=1 Tax=Pandoraea terrae TaxID=1537710 RepID=A0A5E4UU87_9BURK|nr:glycosyltransferase family 2 protein [Pandoraea terrae]VVE02475.1 glycosyltransferase group 2 [Pandoraea terrae]
MTLPLVTVIIPTCRRASMVRRAVLTALAQDYPHVEILVIDDNTQAHEQRAVRQVLADFGEAVTVMPNTRRKGACGARNTGILCARGEFVAFLDDDDGWLPGKLRQQVALLERAPLAGAYCDFIDVGFGHARRCRTRHPLLTRTLALRGECPTSTSLVMVRTAVLKNAGLFDESLASFQDFDMWLRCLSFGDFGCVGEALATFVQHHGDRTSVNLERRAAGLAAIEAKWGKEMSEHADFREFRRRVTVAALIENGKAALGRGYFTALRFFGRAFAADRFSIHAGFWFAVGLLGARWGRALYGRSLKLRRVETASVPA